MAVLDLGIALSKVRLLRDRDLIKQGFVGLDLKALGRATLPTDAFSEL
jgi:hypothetical protein